MAGDGVQATDLKRVGKAVPKVYVHKDGKTIMIPAEKKDEYMAKGYKLSSLRAEGVMSSYGQYLEMEFKRQNKYKNIHDFEASPEFQALIQQHPVFKDKEQTEDDTSNEDQTTNDVKAILDKHGIKSTDDIEYGSDAFSDLFDYFSSDPDEMPYGVQKARTGMPDEWIADRLIDLGLLDEDDTSSKGMNKYGLAAVNKDGKFYSYRNGKLTGTFDNMKDLQKHQHDLIKNEDLGQMAHKVEQDHEVQMARSDLYKAAKYSIKLHERLKNISEEEGLEGWVAAKITKASDYLSSVFHYMDYEMMSSEEMTESRTKIVQAIKAKSEQPQPTYKETINKKYQAKLEEMSKKPVLEDFVGKPISEEEFDRLAEKQDACYHKVKARYKVWPSAYASGALVQCRKKGAANWGNKSKK